MSPSFFKKSGAAAIYLKSASKNAINVYIKQLASSGYTNWGTPIEFRAALPVETLRESARQYAAQNGCSLIVEVQDPNPMSNPYNPYKYYLFQYTGGAYNPPEPPNPTAVQQVQQQAPQRQFAEFICPYCKSKFQTYVNPGRNLLTCPRCKGQSQVDIPAPESVSNLDQGSSYRADISHIKLVGKYQTPEEMIIDCLEVLGKILMVEGNPLEFSDTGEFLYPFIKMKTHAYEHVGFRKMDMILMKEAVHDYRMIGSEQHSQSQANVNPHKDELFSLKLLGGVNFLVLEEFKALEDSQKTAIRNALYLFLKNYVGSTN
ncbi:MAG: hypothetical protein QCI82_05820 [Candidatus Thermoplasmatota archaeon]|nr:hypothetical protein [Candidatus Thermoplasmatota archaeon]